MNSSRSRRTQGGVWQRFEIDWAIGRHPRRHEGEDEFALHADIRTAEVYFVRKAAYARVSTEDQSLDPQLDALKKAGCRRDFTDKASAVNGDRPGLADIASHLRSCDVLVIWNLDRLGRTVKGLVEFVSDL